MHRAQIDRNAITDETLPYSETLHGMRRACASSDVILAVTFLRVLNGSVNIGVGGCVGVREHRNLVPHPATTLPLRQPSVLLQCAPLRRDEAAP